MRYGKDTSSWLQRRTVNIITKFFDDIKKLDQNDSSACQMLLYARVKKFFDEMNKVGIKDIAIMPVAVPSTSSTGLFTANNSETNIYKALINS